MHDIASDYYNSADAALAVLADSSSGGFGASAPTGLSSSHITPQRVPAPVKSGFFVGGEVVMHDSRAEWVDTLTRQDRWLSSLNRHDRHRVDRFQRAKSKRVVRIMYARGGSILTVKCPPSPYGQKAPQVKRGRVHKFSAGSRVRLMKRMNTLDRRRHREGGCWFVTLTYPRQWESDPRRWKRDLDAFRKRLVRRWGKLAAFWKLEPQKRGAPHFHLMLWMERWHLSGLERRGKRWKPNEKRHVDVWAGGVLREFIGWCAEAWYEVVGSGDERHRNAGTSVEVVRSVNGSKWYASKYIGKECEFRTDQLIDRETGEILSVGRYWGVWARKKLPSGRKRWVTVEPETWLKMRRALRRLTGRRGALTGTYRNTTLFVGDEAVRQLLRHYAGRWAWEMGGKFHAWAEPIKQRWAAQESAPATADEEALSLSAEVNPATLWSLEDGGNQYLN